MHTGTRVETSLSDLEDNDIIYNRPQFGENTLRESSTKVFR